MSIANENKNIRLPSKVSNSTVAQTSSPTDFKGAYYLSELPNYYEPQRGNCFTFVVPDLDSFITKADLRELGVVTSPDLIETALELSVKASSVPQFTIDPLTIDRGNSQMHFAGKPKFSEGKITVHDYIGAHTKEILLAWQYKAYNPNTEKVGLASDYKKDAYLYELTPDFQIVRKWILYGCWISGVSEGEYDHNNSENRTMDATVIYDYAVIDTSELAEEE